MAKENTPIVDETKVVTDMANTALADIENAKAKIVNEALSTLVLMKSDPVNFGVALLRSCGVKVDNVVQTTE